MQAGNNGMSSEVVHENEAEAEEEAEQEAEQEEEKVCPASQANRLYLCCHRDIFFLRQSIRTSYLHFALVRFAITNCF